jgi:hypothetical protein
MLEMGRTRISHETVVVLTALFRLDKNPPNGISAGHLEVEKSHHEHHELVS